LGRNFIASLSHGLSVLEAVADSSGDIPLAELAKRVGLKKTSTWRLAHTLVNLGYLHQDPETRNFRPAPRVLSLGYAYFDGLDLKQLSMPVLRELSTRFNETVNLAVADGDELIYVERIRSSQIVTINLHVGSRLPLYSTSLGRALICEKPDAWVRQYVERLAGDPRASSYLPGNGQKLVEILHEAREREYALNDEELTQGLRAISSPVRDQTTEIVAAVCIAAPSSRVTSSDLRRTFAPALIAAASKISVALGYRGKEPQQLREGRANAPSATTRPLSGARSAR
jgi:IclR family transcriptional regulator, pca regulon regulatory protein